MSDHPVMTKDEVGTLLRVRPSTVEAMARRGDLPSFFVGDRRLRRYRRSDVLGFIDGA
jgi:excisionase family DNA binding protein